MTTTYYVITEQTCAGCGDSLMLDTETQEYFSTVRGTEADESGITGFGCVSRPIVESRRIKGYGPHRVSQKAPRQESDQIVWFSTKPCPFCEATDVLLLRLDELTAWMSGTQVQDAFPRLSANKREQILTGAHPDCWDRNVGGIQ